MRPRLTPFELRTLAASAWGKSDPIAHGAQERARLETRLREEIELAVGRPVIGFQGVLYGEDEYAIAPGLGMTVDVGPMSVIFEGSPVTFDQETLTIPRPSDGVVREPVLLALDDGFGGIVVDSFDTLGVFAAPPVVEYLRDGVFGPLVFGVDYDAAGGIITTIAASPTLQAGDLIHITAQWSGAWSVEVSALQDGTYNVRRGFTSTPQEWFHLRFGVSPGEVLLAVIHNVDDAWTTIDANAINKRVAQRVDSSAVQRYFDGPDAHRHTGAPNDGPVINQFERVEAAEGISAFDAVARNAAGKAVKADRIDADRFLYLGIALDGVLSGEILTVQVEGKIENPLWTWALASHPYLYVGLSGGLEQVSPVDETHLVQQVGLVMASDQVSLRPRNRLIL